MSLFMPSQSSPIMSATQGNSLQVVGTVSVNKNSVTNFKQTGPSRSLTTPSTKTRQVSENSHKHPQLGNEYSDEINQIFHPRTESKYPVSESSIKDWENKGIINKKGEINFSKLGVSRKDLHKAKLSGTIRLVGNKIEVNISGNCGPEAAEILKELTAQGVPLSFNPDAVNIDENDRDILMRGGQIQIKPLQNGKIFKLTLDPGKNGDGGELTLSTFGKKTKPKTKKIPLSAVFGGQAYKGARVLANGHPILEDWQKQNLFERSAINIEKRPIIPFIHHFDLVTLNNTDDADRIQSENTLWNAVYTYLKAVETDTPTPQQTTPQEDNLTPINVAPQTVTRDASPIAAQPIETKFPDPKHAQLITTPVEQQTQQMMPPPMAPQSPQVQPSTPQPPIHLLHPISIPVAQPQSTHSQSTTDDTANNDKRQTHISQQGQVSTDPFQQQPPTPTKSVIFGMGIPGNSQQSATFHNVQPPKGNAQNLVTTIDINEETEPTHSVTSKKKDTKRRPISIPFAEKRRGDKLENLEPKRRKTNSETLSKKAVEETLEEDINPKEEMPQIPGEKPSEDTDIEAAEETSNEQTVVIGKDTISEETPQLGSTEVDSEEIIAHSETPERSRSDKQNLREERLAEEDEDPTPTQESIKPRTTQRSVIENTEMLEAERFDTDDLEPVVEVTPTEDVNINDHIPAITQSFGSEETTHSVVAAKSETPHIILDETSQTSNSTSSSVVGNDSANQSPESQSANINQSEVIPPPSASKVEPQPEVNVAPTSINTSQVLEQAKTTSMLAKEVEAPTPTLVRKTVRQSVAEEAKEEIAPFVSKPEEPETNSIIPDVIIDTPQNPGDGLPEQKVTDHREPDTQPKEETPPEGIKKPEPTGQPVKMDIPPLQEDKFTPINVAPQTVTRDALPIAAQPIETKFPDPKHAQLITDLQNNPLQAQQSSVPTNVTHNIAPNAQKVSPISKATQKLHPKQPKTPLVSAAIGIDEAFNGLLDALKTSDISVSDKLSIEPAISQSDNVLPNLTDNVQQTPELHQAILVDQDFKQATLKTATVNTKPTFVAGIRTPTNATDPQSLLVAAQDINNALNALLDTLSTADIENQISKLEGQIDTLLKQIGKPQTPLLEDAKYHLKGAKTCLERAREFLNQTPDGISLKTQLELAQRHLNIAEGRLGGNNTPSAHNTGIDPVNQDIANQPNGTVYNTQKTAAISVATKAQSAVDSTNLRKFLDAAKDLGKAMADLTNTTAKDLNLNTEEWARAVELTAMVSSATVEEATMHEAPTLTPVEREVIPEQRAEYITPKASEASQKFIEAINTANQLFTATKGSSPTISQNTLVNAAQNVDRAISELLNVEQQNDPSIRQQIIAVREAQIKALDEEIKDLKNRIAEEQQKDPQAAWIDMAKIWLGNAQERLEDAKQKLENLRQTANNNLKDQDDAVKTQIEQTARFLDWTLNRLPDPNAAVGQPTSHNVDNPTMSVASSVSDKVNFFNTISQRPAPLKTGSTTNNAQNLVTPVAVTGIPQTQTSTPTASVNTPVNPDHVAGVTLPSNSAVAGQGNTSSNPAADNTADTNPIAMTTQTIQELQTPINALQSQINEKQRQIDTLDKLIQEAEKKESKPAWIDNAKRTLNNAKENLSSAKTNLEKANKVVNDTRNHNRLTRTSRWINATQDSLHTVNSWLHRTEVSMNQSFNPNSVTPVAQPKLTPEMAQPTQERINNMQKQIEDLKDQIDREKAQNQQSAWLGNAENSLNIAQTNLDNAQKDLNNAKESHSFKDAFQQLNNSQEDLTRASFWLNQTQWSIRQSSVAKAPEVQSQQDILQLQTQIDSFRNQINDLQAQIDEAEKQEPKPAWINDAKGTLNKARENLSNAQNNLNGAIIRIMEGKSQQAPNWTNDIPTILEWGRKKLNEIQKLDKGQPVTDLLQNQTITTDPQQ